MGLGDVGAGIGKMAEGFTGGMVQGMQANRMYGMQEKQMKMREEELKLHKQKAFFDSALKALEITPDDKLDGWLAHYNGVAGEYGFPSLAGVKRKDKNEYQFVEKGGKGWIFNKATAKLEPAMHEGQQIESGEKWQDVELPGGGLGQQNITTGKKTMIQRPEKELENWSAPYKDDYGNFVQTESRTGKSRKVTGAPKADKPALNPAQAEKRHTDLTIAKTKLGQTNVIDKLLAVSLGLQEGQQLSDDEKRATIARIDDEIATLEQYKKSGGGAGSGTGGKQAKTVVRTGTYNGRKVAEYSDGTTGYVD